MSITAHLCINMGLKAAISLSIQQEMGSYSEYGTVLTSEMRKGDQLFILIYKTNKSYRTLFCVFPRSETQVVCREKYVPMGVAEF